MLFLRFQRFFCIYQTSLVETSFKIGVAGALLLSLHL
jgi:hypothetical protein